LVLSGGAVAGAAQAQAVSDQQSPDSTDELIVTGVRESLRSAQAIKRNAAQIVDSVQATDIGKLPDANTTEALQRITGVQIQRRYGEGATDFDHRTQPAVTVRGLTQTLNLLDGRAVFSAAGSRALDLEGIPPELLAGIDVYKNPPADVVEGGVGGAINLRTRLPFDSAKTVISTTAKGNYYDRADKFGGTVSGLYSTRFDTGIGEMGLLVNAVYGKSVYRQDAILVGEQVVPVVCGATGCPSSSNPTGTVSASTAIAGRPADGKVPLGFQIYDDNGDRHRLGVAAAYQWQMSDDLLFTGQAQYTDYKFNRTGAYFYPNNAYTNVQVNSAYQYDPNGKTIAVATPQPGAAFTFNDQGYATSGAIAYQTYESGRFDQALRTHSGNYTANLKWSASPDLKMGFDVQYMSSVYDADRNGLVLSQHVTNGETPYPGDANQAPNQQVVTFDLRGSRPVWNVSNPAAFTDANKYTITYMADSLQRNKANQLALAYDAEYDLSGGFITQVRGGLRYTDSDITLQGFWDGQCNFANRAPGSCDAPVGAAFPKLSDYPQLFKQGPSDNFFDGRTLPGGVLYSEFLPGSGLWNSLGATYALLGAQRKLSFTPADITSLNEKTFGGWATANYAAELESLRIDGNVGLRVVRTKLVSNGTQFNSDNTTTPISLTKIYTSALPSVNVRVRTSDMLQFRGAYSKAITRPNFDQLSTNLSLGAANQVNPKTGHPSASQGNPYLDPIKSDNFDLTAEWYPARTTSLTAGLFYKKTKGFIFGDNVVRTYGGVAYDTATSTNAGKGTIKGFELAYQQFFDFLPGPLSGLGIQANYTYADSNVDFTTTIDGNSVTTQRPLEKLSKHSYNIVGLYEKGPVSARLAWNWRGAYFDTTSGSGANGSMQYQSPYATLDASINVDVNAHLAVSVDAVNLNNRMGVTYIDTPSQPLQYTLNDRRIGFSIRATY
jgi:iron complex outermembrane recepter protein